MFEYLIEILISTLTSEQVNEAVDEETCSSAITCYPITSAVMVATIAAISYYTINNLINEKFSPDKFYVAVCDRNIDEVKRQLSLPGVNLRAILTKNNPREVGIPCGQPAINLLVSICPSQIEIFKLVIEAVTSNALLDSILWEVVIYGANAGQVQALVDAGANINAKSHHTEKSPYEYVKSSNQPGNQKALDLLSGSPNIKPANRQSR